MGVLVAVFLYQLYFYGRYILSVLIHERIRLKQLEQQPRPDFPGVSVIICARNEAENLSTYLHSILSQDYPTYEVIVVNDGSEDDTQAVLNAYARHDKRLKLTFVPLEARIGSTKKLGLTLAAKAAQYDYLLLTDGDCRPVSQHWITAMMEGVTPHKEIVLGYGGYFVEHGVLNGLIRYDTLFNGLHYMGAAIASRPYMGVGRNLLYRKSLFFSTGGFISQMNARSGDDDLFVNKVATHSNTTVVASRESVTWSPAKSTFHTWIEQKRRHLSVSPQYRFSTKFHLTIEPVSRAIFYILIVLIGFLCPLPCLYIALALFALRLLLQYIMLNMGSRMLGQGHIAILMMVWDIFLPIINMYLLLTNSLYKSTRW